MDTPFRPCPLAGISAKDLYALASAKRFEDEAMKAVEAAGREAIDKALMLGIAAYMPGLATHDIADLKRSLTMEPTHEEGLQLVLWAPTGEAIMFIGEPKWPEGEHADLSKITIEVPYELVKDQDRRWLGRRNGNY
jgi:hypothetical protein